MGATCSDGEGVDPETGLSWFRDDWTFAGGTGLSASATGSGIEGDSFAGLDAVLAGTPVPMWIEGTITCNPSGK